MQWTSTCKDASFSDATILNPVLTLSAEDAQGAPQSCEVTLTVNGESVNAKSTCVVGVQPCDKDCLGEINGSSKPDRCGVCNGDGQSCINCEPVDLQGDLLALDGLALNQRNLVFKATRALLKASPGTKTAAFVTKSNTLAKQLYAEAWTQIYSIPTMALTCVESEFCTSISTTGYVTSLTDNAKKLSDLLDRVIRKLRKASKKNNAGSKLVTTSNSIQSDAAGILGGLPKTFSSCE